MNLKKQNQNLQDKTHNHMAYKEDADSGLSDCAAQCAMLMQNDPDLCRLIDAWKDLPDHIRAAVLVLIDGFAVSPEANEKEY